MSFDRPMMIRCRSYGGLSRSSTHGSVTRLYPTAGSEGNRALRWPPEWMAQWVSVSSLVTLNELTVWTGRGVVGCGIDEIAVMTFVMFRRFGAR